jgi:tetratricopeptide (TPR) repeat protein
MVNAETLRGALRWNAADEARNRIDAVRTTVDAAATTKPTAPAAPAFNAASQRAGDQRDLRTGLGELDAVRQFLQDHINSANRDFLHSGNKDEQLHDALQHGLSELEDVRRRLVHTLSSSELNQKQSLQQQQERQQHQQPPTAPSSGRPPSASAAKPAKAAAAASTNTAYAAAADNTDGEASRKMLQDHAKRLFRGQRPASATTRNVAGGGESLHGTTDGLRSTATRLNTRPASATVRSASLGGAPPSRTAASETTPPSASLPQGGARSASEGPRLGSHRSRPTSAPVSRDPPTASQQQQGAGAAPNNTTTSSNPADHAAGPSTQWAKYQDWAQRVMSTVHSRRVMKHRQALEKERSTSLGGSSSLPAGFTDDVVDDEGESEPQSPAQPPVTPPVAAAPPKATTSLKAPPRPPQQQRPQSAAFSSLRRAQAAATATGSAAATLGVPASTGAASRPLSATVRGAHGGSGGAPAPSSNLTSSSSSAPRLDANAQHHREQGNVAFQQKRYADAAEAYSKAIALEPNSELLHCNRAAAQLMLGKFHAALADAQAAIVIEPNHVKAHWRAAKASLYLGQTDQARSLYAQAQKLADSAADRDAIIAEGRAADLIDRCRRCIRLREYSDAVKAADALRQIFPPNGPCSMPWLCLRCEAQLHIDAADALQTVTKYTNEDPQCAEAWYLRAKAVFYTGHDAVSTSAALGFLSRCKEVDPKHNRAAVLVSSIEAFALLRDQGNSGYANGRWQEAYVAYTKCLAVDPYNNSLKAIILCNRSAVCIQCERWKDALDDITQSINCNPQNAKAYTRRARILQQQGSHDAAVKDLQLAAQMYPSAENQERLQQAVEARTRAQRGPQSAGGTGATSGVPQSGSSTFRYFNFAGGSAPSSSTASGTAGGPSRPSTAGTSRSGPGGGAAGGASRPQSASQSRGGGAGANPYTIPRPAAAAAPKEPSHYEVLGVLRTTDDKGLTRAYRDAALRWHPDKWTTATDGEKTQAEENFKKIAAAYTILKDATKRRQYDHSQF